MDSQRSPAKKADSNRYPNARAVPAAPLPVPGLGANDPAACMSPASTISKMMRMVRALSRRLDRSRAARPLDENFGDDGATDYRRDDPRNATAVVKIFRADDDGDGQGAQRSEHQVLAFLRIQISNAPLPQQQHSDPLSAEAGDHKQGHQSPALPLPDLPQRSHHDQKQQIDRPLQMFQGLAHLFLRPARK